MLGTPTSLGPTVLTAYRGDHRRYGKVGEIVGLTEDAAEDFILVRFPESMPQGYPPQARARVRVRVRVRG